MSAHLQDSVPPLPEASPAEGAELSAYNVNVFEPSALAAETCFPLPDEGFVPFWRSLAEESRSRGAFAVLRERLPQLNFPIRAGISESEPYRAATRRGIAVGAIPEATGLQLDHPEAIEIAIHLGAAGRIPLLIARRRAEFEALLQALACRNEPKAIPPAQGALMVSGYNNWCRIGELRSRWEALEPAARPAATWGEELRRLESRKELYQDRFILLSDGPYSAVPAADLGLRDEEWREMSLVIRREHECAHYLTRRLFGSMRNHLLDELMADYVGLVAATGQFRADWFLRFLGLEDFPRYRAGGRLDLYRGDPPLSEGAFRHLHHTIHAAAHRLERFDGARRDPPDLTETALTLAALASFRLDELATPGAEARLRQTVERYRDRRSA
jgi:hypothetical protein